jgi:uncharacterized RDD family membrane protein YckC
MSRRGPDDEPSLFDLPLGDGVEKREAERPRSRPPREEWDRPDEEELPLWSAPPGAAAPPPEPRRAAREFPRPAGASPPVPPPAVENPGAFFHATVGSRLVAGLADFAIHLMLLLGLLLGLRSWGIEIQLADIPALATFVLVFSFLYSTISLAFWGRTPGMRWAHLIVRAEDGGGLTFGETARRWFGGLLTLALVGLPLVFSFGGRRSLADRLSHSRTFSV